MNDEWKTQDFSYEGTSITGFSKIGIEKFKTNKDVILPSINAMGQTITKIEDRAFLIADFDTKQDSSIGINSISIPNTVKVIGKEAFRYNALKSIDIPSSVTTIEMLAFSCNKLETLEISNNVSSLGKGAFNMNEISSLTLPNSIKVVPLAFAFNKLTKLTIPKGITKIEDLAFSDNELVEVNLPSTLKYLSGFNNNRLKTITIPKSVREIGFKAFASNKMTSVIIPGNVKIVGKRAFWNTWHDQLLSKVTLEKGVEELREFCFRDNNLKDVAIQSSIKFIDKSAFGGKLGHKKIVHLYTPDFKNINNLSDSEGKYIINPAKIIVKYKCKDKILKEEQYVKSEGKYFHIGDVDVKITPKYYNSKYELKEKNIKTINLIAMENTVTFECVEKEIEEDIGIKSMGTVGSVAVDLGTNKNLAIDKLNDKTFIIDTNNKKHEVLLKWTLNNYDENKPGRYQAIGIFELPKSIHYSISEAKLEIKSNIVVKEKLEDSNWNNGDFIYEGAILRGFSKSGKEKIKVVKNLVLPNVNFEGQAITHIGASAFKELNIEKISIPEGILEIGALSFSNNNISYIDFPGTVKRVGNQAFCNNKLIDIIFHEGEGTLCLDSMSFLGNKLTSITILKEVKKIHEDAFKNNLGYTDEKKVNIYLSKLDLENNGLFENSDYHKINQLPGGRGDASVSFLL